MTLHAAPLTLHDSSAAGPARDPATGFGRGASHFKTGRGYVMTSLRDAGQFTSQAPNNAGKAGKCLKRPNASSRFPRKITGPRLNRSVLSSWASSAN